MNYYSDKSLSWYMNYSDFGYQLERVKNVTNHLSYLMNPTTKGQYVCLLKDNNCVLSHTVGVNCDSKPKMIWDCCEHMALELTRSNLDRCVGEHETFSSIETMGYIKAIV